jgi:hypothetical protein
VSLLLLLVVSSSVACCTAAGDGAAAPLPPPPTERAANAGRRRCTCRLWLLLTCLLQTVCEAALLLHQGLAAAAISCWRAGRIPPTVEVLWPGWRGVDAAVGADRANGAACRGLLLSRCMAGLAAAGSAQ